MKQKAYLLLLFIFFSTACSKEPVIEPFKPEIEITVLFPTEGIGDRGFIDIVYEGIETAKLDFNASINYVIPDSHEEELEWIRNLPNYQGKTDLPSLIIIAGSQFINPVNELDGDFGPHKIFFIGGKLYEQQGLASVIYHTYAASYIGAYLSTQLVSNCRALVVAGFNAPFFTEYIAGFKEGVVDAGGTVNSTEFLSDGFSGFEMPELAYQKTNILLLDNDLIFALSSGSNIGIINAVRNYPEQRYVIGVDADQSWMGLNVVTGSVVKLFGIDIYSYIEQFSLGNFESGNFVRKMEDGAAIFFINEIVMGGGGIPDELIETAIQKEKQYLLNQ